MMTAFEPSEEIFAPWAAGRRTTRVRIPIDFYVGGRVRLRRIFLGYSQQKLGHALGLTFQQIQKYERGINRISASKLFELSQVLDVPVSFFFEGAAGEPTATILPQPRDATAGYGHERQR